MAEEIIPKRIFHGVQMKKVKCKIKVLRRTLEDKEFVGGDESGGQKQRGYEINLGPLHIHLLNL